MNEDISFLNCDACMDALIRTCDVCLFSRIKGLKYDDKFCVSVLKERYKFYKPLYELPHKASYQGWDEKSDKNVLINKLNKYYKPVVEWYDYEIGLRESFKNIKGLLPYLIECIETKDSIYQVYETFECESLKFYVQQEGKLDESMAVYFCLQILEIIGELHKLFFVLHNTINPNHIYITDRGIIKIDLDYTSVCKNNERKILPVFYPEFAPLEVYTSKKKMDFSSDIYSIGAVLYYMLTGKVPQDSIDRLVDDNMFNVIGENISVGLMKIIEKSMQLKSKKRYQTVYDMQNALLKRDILI